MRGVCSRKVLREFESLSPVRAFVFPRPNAKPPPVRCKFADRASQRKKYKKYHYYDKKCNFVFHRKLKIMMEERRIDKATSDKIIIKFVCVHFIFCFKLIISFLLECRAADAQRLAAWRSGGGTQKLGRATNFQIPAKLSASIHPD